MNLLKRLAEVPRIASLKIAPLCFGFLALGGGLLAQESVNASGGDASSAGGSIAYSIGQVAYHTFTGTSGSEAQGVQHAFEIFTVGLPDAAMALDISVYPNPAVESLTLHVADFGNETLSYQLYGTNGVLLASHPITNESTQVDLTGFAAAAYHLHVISAAGVKVGLFKIVKN